MTKYALKGPIILTSSYAELFLDVRWASVELHDSCLLKTSHLSLFPSDWPSLISRRCHMSINVSVFSCSQQFFFLLADEKNCMFATVFQRWGFETDWKIWLDETWFSHSLKDLLPLFSDPLLYFTQRNKTVGWHYQGKTELGKRFKGVWYFKAATASPNLLPPPKDMGCALVGNDKVPLVHGYQLL